MFYIVCASTATSSLRIGCPGPVEAHEKMLELEGTGLGKVRVFDDTGNRISMQDLAARVANVSTADTASGHRSTAEDEES